MSTKKISMKVSVSLPDGSIREVEPYEEDAALNALASEVIELRRQLDLVTGALDELLAVSSELHAEIAEQHARAALAAIEQTRQEEREACAKVCEEAKTTIWEFHDQAVRETGANVCDNLAARIRAGNVKEGER